MKPIQLQATLEGIGHRKDGSDTLRFCTQEQSPEQQLITLEYFQRFGWLMFSPEQFEEADIPKEQATDKTKTESQRLRAVLFILWKQKSKQPDFDTYYKQQMERIIDTVKDKLE